MPTNAGEGVVPIHADLAPLQRDIETGIKNALSTASSKMQSWGKNLFRSGAAITAAVSAPIALGFKGAIDAASDLTETTSKTVQVFGDFSDGIFELGDTSAKSLGLSRQAALDAASSFGNMFTQLGIARPEAARMSTAMLQLASDFGSFHNVDPTEVLEAQSAAFRGEYDSLQRFLPLINAATVEQRALAATGKDSTKELTAQEKALAVQALMLEGAGAAAGDFARTADGAANKQRILHAEMADAAATIGQSLLPTWTTFLGWVQKGATWFAELAQPIQGIILAGAGLLLVMGPLVAIVGALAVAVGVLVSPVTLVVLAVAALALGVYLAYQRFEGFRNVVDGVVQWLATTVPAVVGQVVGYVQEQFGNLVAWTQSQWGAIREAVGHVLRVVSEIVGMFVDAISALWRAWGDDLARIASTVFGTIRTVVKAAVDFIRNIIQTVLALINGDWGKAWDGIKGALSAVWEAMKAIVVGYIGVLKGLLGGAASTLGEAWRGVWDRLKEIAKGGIDAVVGFVRDLPGRILGLVSLVASAALAVGKSILQGIVDGVSGAVGVVADIAAAIGRAIRGVVNSIIDRVNRGLEFTVKGPGFLPDIHIDPPDIPRLHSGGQFRAPSVGGEGLALLRDGEQVTTPEDQAELLGLVRRLVAGQDRQTDRMVRIARTGG